MEIFIMKALFVLIGVIPVAKRLDLFRKRIKLNFPEVTDVQEEDMELLRPIIEEGEKKK